MWGYTIIHLLVQGENMWKYITKRLLLCLVILFGVSIIVYTLVRLMPTDYIDQKYSAQLANGTMNQSDVDRIKKLYGLYLPNARVVLKFDEDSNGEKVKDTFGKSSFELGFSAAGWEDKTATNVDEKWFVKDEYSNGDYGIEFFEGNYYRVYNYFDVYSTPDSRHEIYADEAGAYVLYDDLEGNIHKIYVSEFGAGYEKDAAFRLEQGTNYIFVTDTNDDGTKTQRTLNSTILTGDAGFLTPAKKKQITGFNGSTWFENKTSNPNVLSFGKYSYKYDAESDLHSMTFEEYEVGTNNPTGVVYKTSKLTMGECNGIQKLGYILEGYFTWLGNLLQGDLGMSFLANMPVAEVIKKNMWVSFSISLVALVLQFAIAIPLGITSATHQYGAMDYTVTILAMMGISLPSFFMARLLISVFAVKLRWLPASGLGSTNETFDSGWAAFVDKIPYVILPMVVLVVLSIGGLMRHTRTNMLEVLNSDYIRTARAKGLSEKKVIYKHAFKNTMIPLVTMLAGTLPGLFGGAMITEQVFSLPGIGNQAYKSLINGDVPFIMGYNMFLAVLSVIGILLSDFAYMLVDPRVKISK